MPPARWPPEPEWSRRRETTRVGPLEVALHPNRQREPCRIRETRGVADDIPSRLTLHAEDVGGEVLDAAAEVDPATRFAVGIVAIVENLPYKVRTRPGGRIRLPRAVLPVVGGVEQEFYLPEMIFCASVEARARPPQEGPDADPRREV